MSGIKIGTSWVARTPRNGDSLTSQANSYSSYTTINNGGTASSISAHYIWGQLFDGTKDITGDMSNVRDISSNGTIWAPNIMQDGYRVLDVSNSGIGDGWVRIANTTKYFLPTDSNGIVQIHPTFNNGITVNGDLYAQRIDVSYIHADQGDIEDLTSTNIVTDYLTVNKSAHFFELIIDQIRASKGTVLVSPGYATIDLVENISGGYRCYYRATDNDGKQIRPTIQSGDQVICQTFNVATGVSYNVSNNYWWRLCTGQAEDVVKKVIDGREWDCWWFDISSTDGDTGSSTPAVGDEVAVLGNRTDTQRQGAIVITAMYNSWLDSSVNGPAMIEYWGINNYELKSHRQSYMSNGRNVFKGTFVSMAGDDIETLIDDATEGLKSCIHFAWGNSSADWTKDPARADEGWKYLGTCANYTEDDSGLNYGDYRWSLMRGADGLGIEDVEEWYLASPYNSGVSRSTTGWTKVAANAQLSPTNKYLWNYEKRIFSNGTSPKYVEPHIIGVYGDNGKSISDIENWYTISDLSTGLTTDSSWGWTKKYQAPTSAKPYCWNYEIILYDDNTSTTVQPHIMGAQGERGAGITKLIEWYHIWSSDTNGPTRDTAGWTNTTDGSPVPSPTKEEPWLWNYEETIYDDGHHTYTRPHVSGGLGEDGRSIIDYQEWYLVTDQVSGVTRSTAGWSKDAPSSNISEVKPYLWNYNVVVFDSGDPYYGTPFITSIYNKVDINLDDLDISIGELTTSFYKLVDMGTTCYVGVTENDPVSKLRVRLALGIVYTDNTGSKIITTSSAEWPSSIYVYYKLNTTSNYSSCTKQTGNETSFVASRDLTASKTDTYSYVSVKLQVGSREVDWMTFPVVMAHQAYFTVDETLNAWIGHVGDNSTKINQLTGQVTQLNNYVTDISINAQGLHGRISDIEDDYDDLTNEISGVKTRTHNLEVSAGGFQSSISSLSGSITALNSSIGTLATQISQSNASLTDKYNTLNTLVNNNYNSLYDMIEDIPEQKDWTGEINGLRLDLTNMQNTLDQYKVEKVRFGGANLLSGSGNGMGWTISGTNVDLYGSAAQGGNDGTIFTNDTFRLRNQFQTSGTHANSGTFNDMIFCSPRFKMVGGAKYCITCGFQDSSADLKNKDWDYYHIQILHYDIDGKLIMSTVNSGQAETNYTSISGGLKRPDGSEDAWRYMGADYDTAWKYNQATMRRYYQVYTAPKKACQGEMRLYCRCYKPGQGHDSISGYRDIYYHLPCIAMGDTPGYWNDGNDLAMSQIKTTADEINLSVTSKLQSTGIDIVSGQITLDASRVQINGSLNMDYSNGIVINKDNVPKIQIVPNALTNSSENESVTENKSGSPHPRATESGYIKYVTAKKDSYASSAWSTNTTEGYDTWTHLGYLSGSRSVIIKFIGGHVMTGTSPFTGLKSGHNATMTVKVKRGSSGYTNGTVLQTKTYYLPSDTLKLNTWSGDPITFTASTAGYYYFSIEMSGNGAANVSEGSMAVLLSFSVIQTPSSMISIGTNGIKCTAGTYKDFSWVDGDFKLRAGETKALRFSSNDGDDTLKILTSSSLSTNRGFVPISSWQHRVVTVSSPQGTYQYTSINPPYTIYLSRIKAGYALPPNNISGQHDGYAWELSSYDFGKYNTFIWYGQPYAIDRTCNLDWIVLPGNYITVAGASVPIPNGFCIWVKGWNGSKITVGTNGCRTFGTAAGEFWDEGSTDNWLYDTENDYRTVDNHMVKCMFWRDEVSRSSNISQSNRWAWFIMDTWG